MEYKWTFLTPNLASGRKSWRPVAKMGILNVRTQVWVFFQRSEINIFWFKIAPKRYLSHFHLKKKSKFYKRTLRLRFCHFAPETLQSSPLWAGILQSTPQTDWKRHSILWLDVQKGLDGVSRIPAMNIVWIKPAAKISGLKLNEKTNFWVVGVSKKIWSTRGPPKTYSIDLQRAFMRW